jgi:hypothetical protein
VNNIEYFKLPKHKKLHTHDPSDNLMVKIKWHACKSITGKPENVTSLLLKGVRSEVYPATGNKQLLKH